MKNEIMIDAETTGRNPGCKVLTLGAFGFNIYGEQVRFYERFDFSKMGAAGLFDEQETIDWWFQQREEIRKEAFEGKTNPSDGLANFKMFLLSNFDLDKDSGFRVWCCGADFDFPILKEFFRRFGFAIPWKFYQQCDYRTVKNLFPSIKSEEGEKVEHVAIEDAMAQMRGLRCFYKLVQNTEKSQQRGAEND